MNFVNIFSRYPQIPNFIRIRPVGAEWFHAEERTDKTDMTKLRVLCCMVLMRLSTKQLRATGLGKAKSLRNLLI